MGYERASGYEALIGVDVNTPMRSNNSVYIRIEFNVSDLAAFDGLELRMKNDDGFVAFLNGAVLASAYEPASLQWNSAATVSHEANPAAFNIYDVTDKKGNLRVGRNVLAIQGLNDSLSSSDMIIVPELYGARLLPASTGEPKIDFGTIEVNPRFGQPGRGIHPAPQSQCDRRGHFRMAADRRGRTHLSWRDGSCRRTVRSTSVSECRGLSRADCIAERRRGAVWCRAATKGISPISAKLSRFWTLPGATNNATTYQGQPSDAQRYLVVSELMYHPSGDGLAEFIELLNISGSVTLDLRGVRFTQGVEFDFTGSAITSLAPGARVLIVRDVAAFSAAYGTNHPVAGVFTNGTALSNSGERIKLEDADNETIREFAYDDEAPWPAATDAGYSLVLIAPETNPDHALATNWRASTRPGGSPGGPDGRGISGGSSGRREWEWRA